MLQGLAIVLLQTEDPSPDSSRLPHLTLTLEVVKTIFILLLTHFL